MDETRRSGRRSIYVMSLRCCKNESGVSATTWSTRIRVCSSRAASAARGFDYIDYRDARLEILDEPFEERDKVLCLTNISRNRLLEQIIGQHCAHVWLSVRAQDVLLTRVRHERVFVCRRRDRLLKTLDKLCIFILELCGISPLDPVQHDTRDHEIIRRRSHDIVLVHHAATRFLTHSSILSPSFVTLRAAESSIGRVRSTLNDSMHTLSTREGIHNFIGTC